MNSWKELNELDIETLARSITEKTGIEFPVVLKVLDAETDYLIDNGFAVIED